MNAWGVYFLGFVGKYGYDQILKVLGRHVRDFVNGLDNLHEYLRFSYPKVQPPTFFCQEESATGVTLHYRSKRKGYLHYAMGQLRQMVKQFYQTDILVSKQSIQRILCCVLYHIHLHKYIFANTPFWWTSLFLVHQKQLTFV
eukprot:gi/632948512/ref/XP_007889638.1/ PREDICTED: soluble guanylate cyclase 88E-like [Callorhinchus milii]